MALSETSSLNLYFYYSLTLIINYLSNNSLKNEGLDIDKLQNRLYNIRKRILNYGVLL